MLLGSKRRNDGLGFAPLVALVAPVAKAAGMDVLDRVTTRAGIGPKKAPNIAIAPACGFWQRVARVFGGRPNCT